MPATLGEGFADAARAEYAERQFDADEHVRNLGEGLGDAAEAQAAHGATTPADWDRVAPYEPVSAADAAQVGQGNPDSSYPHEDQWGTTIASEGDRIWFGEPGLSGYGVLEGDVHYVGSDGDTHGVGNDAQGYYEHVQAAPLDGEYRDTLACYEFTRPCEIGVGVAEANTVNGEGGMRQAYVDDVQARIDDGTLQRVGGLEMDNRTARIQ